MKICFGEIIIQKITYSKVQMYTGLSGFVVAIREINIGILNSLVKKLDELERPFFKKR